MSHKVKCILTLSTVIMQTCTGQHQKCSDVRLLLTTTIQLYDLHVLRLYCLVGASLSEPHTSKSFIGSSFYEHKQKKTYLTSSCVNESSQIYHICSLDRQCHGKNVTKFSRAAIVCSLDLQCHGKHGIKFA